MTKRIVAIIFGCFLTFIPLTADAASTGEDAPPATPYGVTW